jgi:hypothetical protein
MSSPPIPPPLENLGQRPFSFYPPIVNVEHNEWIFRKATWSEILVSNTRSNAEVWIPRRLVGELSRVDDPVMILGLTKELEYKSGQVWPYVRRVIEMPRAVNDVYRPSPPEPQAGPAPIVGIRLESGAESRIGKLILSVLLAGIIGCVVLVSFFRGGRDGSRVTYSPVLQSELGLTADDDFEAVKRKLGDPAGDQWRSDQGELQFRILRYPAQGMSVILMGSERGKERYIGAVDGNWRPIHSVRLPNGRQSTAMLKSIPRF